MNIVKWIGVVLFFYLIAKPPLCAHQFQAGGRFLFPPAEHEAPLHQAELQSILRYRHSASQLRLGQRRWHHPPTNIMHSSVAAYMSPKQPLKQHVQREKGTVGFAFEKAGCNYQPIYSGYMGGGETQICDFPGKHLRKQMQLPIVCGSPRGIIFNAHNDTEISFPQPSNMKYCILLAFWGSTVFFFFLSQIHYLLWLLKYLFSLSLSPP